MRYGPQQRPPTFWELAVQATSNTRQGYNLLAPRFEQTPYATPGWLIEACLERADRLYPVERLGSRGLDLACGTGRASAALAQRCSRVDGIDFSAGMLEQARDNTRHLGETEFSFQEQDLATVDLPEAHYDRIVTFGAWGHILPGWSQRLIGECVKALKPGGVLVSVTADPATLWSRRWWFSAFFDAGLTVRNALLGDPFHMYYRLNDTEQVSALLSAVGGVTVRLEPVPRRPHRDLTLLLAVRNPTAS